MTAEHPGAIEVFYSYAQVDEMLRNELEKHVSLLKRQGLISARHEREVSPGQEWSKGIDVHLNSAGVMLSD